MITNDNWTFAQYSCEHFMAIIGIEGIPNSNGDVDFFYSSILLDQEEKSDIFQKRFNNLDDSISYINNKYGHWDFIEKENLNSSGCDNCN